MNVIPASPRGAASVMMVLMAVGIMGLVALGTEVGSWYASKRAQQNAADAAAMSGALSAAKSAACPTCSGPGYTPVDDGLRAAAENGFCDGGCPGSSLSEIVTVTRGNFRNGVFTEGPAYGVENAVRASIMRRVPAMLSAFVGTPVIAINAGAVAMYRSADNPCVLALYSSTIPGSGKVLFQGSADVHAHCTIAANSAASNALSFNGGVSPAEYMSAVGGCAGTTTQCGNARTNAAPTVDPMSRLTSYLGYGQSVWNYLNALPYCSGKTAQAYAVATACVNRSNADLPATMTGGVYVFKNGFTPSGNDVVTGTGSIVLLSGSMKVTGTYTLNLAAPTAFDATQVPPNLPLNALASIVLYDADRSGTASITFGGTTTVTLSGVIYAPDTAVSWQGTAGQPSPLACNQLIAASVDFSGSPTFSNVNCSPELKPQQIVAVLVQ